MCALLVDRLNGIDFFRLFCYLTFRSHSQWSVWLKSECEILVADYCRIYDHYGVFVFVDHYFKARILRLKWTDSKKKVIIPVLSRTHKKHPNQIKSNQQKIWPCPKVHIYGWTRKLINDKNIMCEFHKQRGIMESNENAVCVWVGWLLCSKIETKRIIKTWWF